MIMPFDAFEILYVYENIKENGKILWKMEHLLCRANLPFSIIFSRSNAPFSIIFLKVNKTLLKCFLNFFQCFLKTENDAMF